MLLATAANNIKILGFASDGESRTRNAVFNRFKKSKNLDIRTDLIA